MLSLGYTVRLSASRVFPQDAFVPHSETITVGSAGLHFRQGSLIQVTPLDGPSNQVHHLLQDEHYRLLRQRYHSVLHDAPLELIYEIH
jgi:hypothetical protein